MDKRQQLTETLTRFIGLVAKTLPDDVLAALEKLRGDETAPLASAVYGCMFDNLSRAQALNRPACQDTGVLQFFLRAGAEFPLLAQLKEILGDAVLEATKQIGRAHV